MGFRFHKRIKLGSGLKLNISKSGLSLTAGIPGVSLNFGSRGIFLNVGIPGTGFSSRTKLGTNKERDTASKEKVTPTTKMEISIRMNDQGNIEFLDSNGAELSEKLIKDIKTRNKKKIEQAIDEYIQKSNHDYEACLSVYKFTPTNNILDFPLPPPEKPVLEKVNFFKNLFGMAESEKSVNQLRLSLYDEKFNSWQSQKNAWPALFDKAVTGDTDAMTLLIEIVLSTILWPKETIISFDFSNDCRTLALDIDLPEVENMPTSVFSRALRGMKINIKKFTDTQIRHDYAKLVHGILFRVMGECFSTLPYLNEILISGFTQRLSKKTGIQNNEYILSVKVKKLHWESINHYNIEAIDPIESLTQFELIRDMKRNYELKKISPFNLSNK